MSQSGPAGALPAAPATSSASPSSPSSTAKSRSSLSSGAQGLALQPRAIPTPLLGIEVNDYAAELARISVWIGCLKWQIENGAPTDKRPILDFLDTIECRDAIIKWSVPSHATTRGSARVVRTGDNAPQNTTRSEQQVVAQSEPLSQPADWPHADFIVGNPPFLGSKLFRKWGFSDDCLKALYNASSLPKTSDLCGYWSEHVRRIIETAKNARATGRRVAAATGLPASAKRKPAPKSPALSVAALPSPRVGLLATQAVRGGDNRTVLERIKDTGNVFFAIAGAGRRLDRPSIHPGEGERRAARKSHHGRPAAGHAPVGRGS